MNPQLYYADVSALADPQLFRRLYHSVSGMRREKVDHIRPTAGKLLSLGAGALLEASLAALGVHWPQLMQDANGKPYLPGRDDLFFNISHSGKHVLCAVSDREIGCDVEKTGLARLALAKRCFCEAEYQALLRCPDAATRDRLFFWYWTLKESFLKATGLGFRLPLNAFCICTEAEQIIVRQSVDARNYSFCSFSGEDYQYAVCSVDASLEGLCLTERSFPVLADILEGRAGTSAK
ncbi:MAG: 4'-phosphopantetheinyl transferase superfamily protein [Oscillospiraceae bacterium]|nr:4'-phosphopantetheinyl transferase superfamily protein [Oscillospiraceae bacterium]